jgi:hypothetical protein
VPKAGRVAWRCRRVWRNWPLNGDFEDRHQNNPAVWGWRPGPCTPGTGQPRTTSCTQVHASVRCWHLGGAGSAESNEKESPGASQRERARRPGDEIADSAADDGGERLLCPASRASQGHGPRRRHPRRCAPPVRRVQDALAIPENLQATLVSRYGAATLGTSLAGHRRHPQLLEYFRRRLVDPRREHQRQALSAAWKPAISRPAFTSMPQPACSPDPAMPATPHPANPRWLG